MFARYKTFHWLLFFPLSNSNALFHCFLVSLHGFWWETSCLPYWGAIVGDESFFSFCTQDSLSLSFDLFNYDVSYCGSQYFGSPNANSWLIGKVLDAGKVWGQEKRVSEDKMTGWHHWCNRHELGQISGDGEGWEGLACCSPWVHYELDMTAWLNSNNIVNLFEFLLLGVYWDSWMYT